MLILSRNVGQTIIINDDIQVKVISVQGGQVRIGVEAPKNMTVDREEIHLRKQAEIETGSPLKKVAGADWGNHR